MPVFAYFNSKHTFACPNVKNLGLALLHIERSLHELETSRQETSCCNIFRVLHFQHACLRGLLVSSSEAELLANKWNNNKKVHNPDLIKIIMNLNVPVGTKRGRMWPRMNTVMETDTSRTATRLFTVDTNSCWNYKIMNNCPAKNEISLCVSTGKVFTV